MSGIAIVRRVDREHGRVDVVVYPESCGRCEENGGHCTRNHREVPVQLPEGIELQPGDHLRLGSSRRAIRRSVVRLILAPFAAALGGFWIGGGRLGRIAPRAAQQISGRADVSLDIPGAAIILALLGIGLVLFFVIRRGVQPEDRPIVVARLSPEESFQPGGVASDGSVPLADVTINSPALRDSNPA